MVAPPQPSSSSASRGVAALARGRGALGADRRGMREELVGDLALPRRSSQRAPPPRRARRPASRSGPGTSRPAAGNRRALSVAVSIAVRPPPITTTGRRICRLAIDVGLGRAGELQRHQEVRRRAHAARQAVRHVEHGRLARAGAQRDVVEAHARRRRRCVERAAEAHAAEHRELRRAAPAAGAPA